MVLTHAAKLLERFMQARSFLWCHTLALMVCLGSTGLAQVVPDGLGTQVQRDGQVIHIRGGQQAGRNLFHSFREFNVQSGETANFWSNPQIQNILARVTGGNYSHINGLIQVLGGRSNLYLLNPAGIIFGPHAVLNVPAAFVATTARQVRFAGGVFGMDTVGVEHLTGNPLALADFGPGKIVVDGAKLVTPGALGLVSSAGVILDGARVQSERGVTVIARPAGWVELRHHDTVLGFEVRADQLAQLQGMHQLPELLTGGGYLAVRQSSVSAPQIVMQGSQIELSGSRLVGQRVRVGDRDTQALRMDNRSRIEADGGVVELIAQKTDFNGTVVNPSGFVEVSGTEFLNFQGQVEAGTLLIDPTNLWIVESNYLVPSGISVLTPAVLISQLQAGNVIVSATNEIRIPFVGSPLDFTGVPSGRSLVLQGANTVTVERGFSNTSSLNFIIEATGTANVSLAATEALALNGGNLIINAPTVNLQFVSLSQIGNTNNNVVIGYQNAALGSGNRVYGISNTVIGNNNSVYGVANTVNGDNNGISGLNITINGSNNIIGSIPTGAFTIGAGSIGSVNYLNTNPNLTPPVFAPPSSGSGQVSEQKVSTEPVNILLQNQFSQLSLPIFSPTFLEIITEIDRSLTSEFGLIGLEAQNDISTIQQMQEIMRQAEEKGRGRTALLYWWLRDNVLTLGLVLPKGTAEQTTYVKTTNLNGKEVEQTIQLFMRLIKDPRERENTRYRQPGQRLYDWLIRPLESILVQHKVETLMIVADEHFRGLAYRALWDGQQHLIEKYRLAQIPSINLVNLELFNRNLLGQTWVMGAAEFGGRQPTLPAVAVEIARVAALVQGRQRFNQDFTAQQFIQDWRSNLGYGFHLATHAEFTPTRNYIEFYDRSLTLEQLQGQLKANPAELVVLSACRTALGSRYAELGFAGLAVRLGAKRAIASLWYLEDEATLGLMQEFYQRLAAAGEQVPHSELLRRAQVSMIRGEVRVQQGELVGNGYRVALPGNLRRDDRTFQHPYYWAAFNLIGNPW